MKLKLIKTWKLKWTFFFRVLYIDINSVQSERCSWTVLWSSRAVSWRLSVWFNFVIFLLFTGKVILSNKTSWWETAIVRKVAVEKVVDNYYGKRWKSKMCIMERVFLMKRLRNKSDQHFFICSAFYVKKQESVYHSQVSDWCLIKKLDRIVCEAVTSWKLHGGECLMLWLMKVLVDGAGCV